MLFYLSQYALDIIFGVSWWTIKKTTDGVYYLLYDDHTHKNKEEEYQPILITKEDLQNETCLDTILEELKKNRQEISEMKKLISNLEHKIKK